MAERLTVNKDVVGSSPTISDVCADSLNRVELSSPKRKGSGSTPLLHVGSSYKRQFLWVMVR